MLVFKIYLFNTNLMLNPVMVLVKYFILIVVIKMVLRTSKGKIQCYMRRYRRKFPNASQEYYKTKLVLYLRHSLHWSSCTINFGVKLGVRRPLVKYNLDFITNQRKVNINTIENEIIYYEITLVQITKTKNVVP